MGKNLVFIYGSLRRGNASAMHIRFPDSKFVANAHVSGRLYDLGAYPGLLLDESQSSVVGEVYEVDDETLSKLDIFEASSDYLRQPVDIYSGDGRLKGWVYVPGDRPDFYSNRTLITSGDWVEYAMTKTG